MYHGLCVRKGRHKTGRSAPDFPKLLKTELVGMDANQAPHSHHLCIAMATKTNAVRTDTDQNPERVETQHLGSCSCQVVISQ